MTATKSNTEREHNFVHDPGKFPHHVLGEETKDKIAVLLQQEVLTAVAPVMLRVREVVRSVDFDR